MKKHYRMEVRIRPEYNTEGNHFFQAWRKWKDYKTEKQRQQAFEQKKHHWLFEFRIPEGEQK